jgi:hypothetical protein
LRLIVAILYWLLWMELFSLARSILSSAYE